MAIEKIEFEDDTVYMTISKTKTELKFEFYEWDACRFTAILDTKKAELLDMHILSFLKGIDHDLICEYCKKPIPLMPIYYFNKVFCNVECCHEFWSNEQVTELKGEVQQLKKSLKQAEERIQGLRNNKWANIQHLENEVEQLKKGKSIWVYSEYDNAETQIRGYIKTKKDAKKILKHKLVKLETELDRGKYQEAADDPFRIGDCKKITCKIDIDSVDFMEGGSGDQWLRMTKCNLLTTGDE